MANFEAMALKHIITGNIAMLPELHPDLFTKQYNKLYMLCLDFFDSNKKLPSMSELQAVVESKAPVAVKPQYLATIEQIRNLDVSGISDDIVLNELRDQKVLREVDAQISELVEAQRDKDPGKVKVILNKLTEKVNLKGIKITDLADAKDSDETHNIVRSFLGEEFEEVLGGGHSGLTVYSAKSGGGKSIALLQTAINNYRAGKNVMFVSLELPRSVLYKRLLSNLTNIDFKVINAGLLTDEEKQKCKDAHDEFFGKHNKNWFKIVDDSISDAELLNLIAVQSQLNDVEVVCIDYLQLVELDGFGDDWRALSSLCKKLHRLTRKYNVCVVTAAQINTEGKEKGKLMPKITARGSKEIEFSATQFIHFDVDPDMGALIMFQKKNRISQPKHMVLDSEFKYMKIHGTDVVIED